MQKIFDNPKTSKIENLNKKASNSTLTHLSALCACFRWETHPFPTLKNTRTEIPNWVNVTKTFFLSKLQGIFCIWSEKQIKLHPRCPKKIKIFHQKLADIKYTRLLKAEFSSTEARIFMKFEKLAHEIVIDHQIEFRKDLCTHACKRCVNRRAHVYWFGVRMRARIFTKISFVVSTYQR